MRTLNKNEIELAKKILFSMKKYKDNPQARPDVKDDIDYNVSLVFEGIIPINRFGEY